MIVLQVLINGLLTGGIYSLISVGLALILGTMRIINIFHGELLMMAMYLTYWLYLYIHLDPYVSVLITAPVLFGFGYVMQRVLINRVLAQPEVNQVLLTLGISMALINLFQLFFSPTYRQVRTGYSTAVLAFADVRISIPYTISFMLAFAFTFLLYSFLIRTFPGKAIRATAQDRQAAVMMGVNIATVNAISFGIGAALAAAAGSLLVPIYYIFPGVGFPFAIKAFVVVVLGGMGSVVGAALGGIIFGVVEALGSFFISTRYTDAIGLLIFIVILLVRPAGLFGRSRV
ncbi:MAG: branched-chain amino acid ABC transporter permease [Candidatus Tectomicrobia bacterium]|nr:branched-chain amino acid ABC transporter permease [Candidatus Tectomicrobia bacterium]